MRNRNFSGLYGVFELVMVSHASDLIPPIRLQNPNHFPGRIALHLATSSLLLLLLHVYSHVSMLSPIFSRSTAVLNPSPQKKRKPPAPSSLSYSVSNKIPNVLGPQWDAMVQLAAVTCTSRNAMVFSTVFRTRSMSSGRW